MQNIKRKLLSAAALIGKRPWLLVGCLCVLVPVTVMAASTTWKLYSFNASGRALRAQKVSYDTSTNTVSFTFPETPDAAYLTSAKVGNFGNLTGQTLKGSASITASPGTTFANYPGGSGSTSDPMVGLYFSTKGTGGFDPTIYWWSTKRVPLSTILAHPGTPLDTQLLAGLWTDYYGQPDPASFNAAVMNVIDWGVSFGGDCFYANGVGTPTGSADFSLQVNP
jgi:hypothetical protein